MHTYEVLLEKRVLKQRMKGSKNMNGRPAHSRVFFDRTLSVREKEISAAAATVSSRCIDGASMSGTVS
jgi:hypothetical protein